MSSARTPTPDRVRAAMVRAVSPRLAQGLRTFRDRSPIDLERARCQHRAYQRVLRDLDVEVVTAPPANQHPDGVFVEDAVVVVDDLAVLTRPGAPERRAEPDALGPVLAARGYRLERVTAPARLDGGDVLVVDDLVYVGVGARTDRAGAEALAEALAGIGRRVVPVAVPGALHLKTAVTALPDGTLVGLPDRIEAEAFSPRTVLPAAEPEGANLLPVNGRVLVSATAPGTAALLAERGLEVIPVEIDEFERAEAGLTCLSVRLPH